MSEWERGQLRHRDTETPAPEQRQRPVGSVARVLFGVQTPEGMLALQRHAGSRATIALMQRQLATSVPALAPAAGQTTVPTLQRGVFSFIGDVVTGAASYVADVGRGFKRAAKGLRLAWPPGGRFPFLKPISSRRGVSCAVPVGWP